jgi:hypothetical protein
MVAPYVAILKTARRTSEPQISYRLPTPSCAGLCARSSKPAAAFPTTMRRAEAPKLLYLAIKNAGLRWRRRTGWTATTGQFAIGRKKRPQRLSPHAVRVLWRATGACCAWTLLVGQSGAEASRFSRLNTARSVCAQRNCLIADDDAVYDPALQMPPQPAHRLDIAGDRRSRATGLRRFRRHPQLVFPGSPPTLVITSTAIIVLLCIGPKRMLAQPCYDRRPTQRLKVLIGPGLFGHDGG